MKCQHCGYENEEGALFCEQCKGDLSSEPAAAPAVAVGVPVAPVVEATPGVAVSAAPAVAVPVSGEVAAAPVAAAAATPVESGAAVAVVAAPAAEAVAPPAAAGDVAAAVAPATPVVEATPVSAPSPAPASSAAVAATPAAPAAPAPAAPEAPAAPTLPPGAQPKLVVLRGLKIGMEYPIYEGLNFIGRADEKPVDIDLEDQEPPDRIWCSRQHAVINFENNCLTIEDLNSSNGTYVNRSRIYPGQKRPLNVGDVIQIGSVQLKVKA